MHPRPALALACAGLAAAGALTLSACSSRSGDSAGQPLAVVSAPTDPSAPPGAISLDTPLAKPDLVLTDQTGKPYDLRKRTAGRALLLYFGYTHCPDVCPTTMADLALALRRLPSGTARPDVVFVSTDPQRDTPGRLKSWLGLIDTRFTGLTGDFATIQHAAQRLGISVQAPQRQDDGSVTVSHGAEVLAFSPADDRAHVLFPSGTPEATYAADLPKVAAGRNR
ncbi:SCO family protein [Actinacidiphila epipremni]|uniref:SCO family protein n=1 Tax=Actinacidiphila epipremni TaxID=2053013 RepID=A0ABX0ZSW9_9ACTN|nr:SCO family protein [Actinacidiphila epipremni]NJP46341.1 SCO family protein [Actinacidiphila epipremni]